MDYQSTELVESAAVPGVRVRLRRMSFGGRLDLARRLQSRLQALDATLAQPEGDQRNAEVALLAAGIEAEYLRWGVEAIEGLNIDGAPATVETLIERGPEELVREIVARVKAGAGLSDEERKNSGPHSTSCAAGRPDRASDGNAASAEGWDSSFGATAASNWPG